MGFRFEDFVLDPERRELRRAEALVALEPQVFDVLTYLVRHRDRVVTPARTFARWGRVGRRERGEAACA